MIGDWSNFVWRAPAEPGAYFWHPPEDGEVLKRRKGSKIRRYQPLKGKESLYRIFAGTAPTREGILAFVDRYGLLGEDMKFLEDWQRWIVRTAEMIRIWDLLQAGNTEALGQVFWWHKDQAVYYVAPETIQETFGLFQGEEGLAEDVRQVTIASTTVRPGLFKMLDPGDPVEPAQLFLLDMLNVGLTHAQPTLLWRQRRSWALLRDYPRDLLGAIYLQFTHAVQDGRMSQQCRVCGRPFEITPAVSRNDRLTCGNTCRTRLYRSRQHKARQLHAQGKTVKQIARQLGAKVANVEKWIQEKKG